MTDTSDDYRKTLRVQADPATLFDALTTVPSLTAWWTEATGSGETGGELRFFFGHPSPCVMRVDQATPASVRWTVTSCDFEPEWVGTHPAFTITPVDGGGSELTFRHHGLTPDLDCIEHCTSGWNHFLGSLRDYAEVGRGSPRGSEADNARRAARTGTASAPVRSPGR